MQWTTSEGLQGEGSENTQVKIMPKIEQDEKICSRFGVALIGLDKMKVWIKTIHRMTAWTGERSQ